MKVKLRIGKRQSRCKCYVFSWQVRLKATWKAKLQSIILVRYCPLIRTSNIWWNFSPFLRNNTPLPPGKSSVNLLICFIVMWIISEIWNSCKIRYLNNFYQWVCGKSGPKTAPGKSHDVDGMNLQARGIYHGWSLIEFPAHRITVSSCTME